MDFAHKALLFVHIVAIAGTLGTLLALLTATVRPVSTVMIWSARVTFLAGLGLVGVLEADDADVNHAKVGTKLLVALMVVGLLEANRKKQSLAQNLYYGVLGLVVLNVGLAVFWS